MKTRDRDTLIVQSPLVTLIDNRGLIITQKDCSGMYASNNPYYAVYFLCKEKVYFLCKEK